MATATEKRQQFSAQLRLIANVLTPIEGETRPGTLARARNVQRRARRKALKQSTNSDSRKGIISEEKKQQQRLQKIRQGLEAKGRQELRELAKEAHLTKFWKDNNEDLRVKIREHYGWTD